MKLKITLLLLFLSIFFISYSQTTHIKAIYKCKVIEKKDSKLRKMMLQAYPNIERNSESIDFVLNVSSNKSSFSVLKSSIIDSKELDASLLIIGFIGNLWCEDGFVFELQPENYVYKSCIIKKQDSKNWELFQDTKVIDGYKCYKAIYKKEIVNPKGTFYENIITWYCPEIPYSFGPMGLSGLPGLIIEAQTKDAIFGLIKITELENNEIIKKPNVEIISSEEYFMKTKNKMDQFFKEK